MDKEKIELAIAQMQVIIDDPLTSSELRESMTITVERMRSEMVEHERDPHGQKRLVDDCHGLIIEIKESVTTFKEMLVMGIDSRAARQIAEHGAITHATEIPFEEQRFDSDFMVYHYRTRHFNEMPMAVSLFKRLMDQPEAHRFKALFMAIARDTDAIGEILHKAKEGSVTEEGVKEANNYAVKVAFFLNPLVMALTSANDNINEYYPSFLPEALTEISKAWHEKDTMAKGGKTRTAKEKGDKYHAKLIEYAYPSSPNAKKAGYSKEGTWFVSLYPTVESHKRGKIDKYFPGTAEGKKEAEAYAESLPQPYNWMHKYYLRGEHDKMKQGGHVKFKDKVEAIEKKLEGTPVPKKYQKTEGNRFTKKTATAAAKRIVGAMEKHEKSKRKMLLGGVTITSPGNMHLMDLNNLDIHSAGGESLALGN